MPSSKQSEGHPVQVVTVTKEERKFQLDDKALGSILLRDAIRDKPVCVLSIAGDYRKGKSFLLNHCLRYLQSGRDSNVWTVNPDRPLTGFSWRGGAERDTTGIWMWSEPFLIGTPKGPVGVVLMDTQGCFDSEYTIKDSATVFALSTMISSLQVFNLMHNLQEDNLQVLDIFCEYGRLAMEELHSKPFQRLIFLIRDWPYPYDHPFGFSGGESLLNAILQVNSQMPEQLQRVRSRIKECFEELECFLMPHPGAIVATSSTFDGRLQDYDEKFLDSLREFVPNLFQSDRLVVKQIGGQKVTGRALLEYFKVYSQVFAGDTMPEPKTVLEATAEANNLTAVAAIQEYYQAKLEAQFGSKQPYVNPELMEERNRETEKNCLEQFDAIPKMGGQDFSACYRRRLCQSMARTFKQYLELNARKNIFSLIGVPIILLATNLFLAFVVRLLQTVNLVAASQTVQTFGNCFMVIVVLYFAARYTGNYPGFILAVERGTEVGWKCVSVFVVRYCLHSKISAREQQVPQVEHQTGQTVATNETQQLPAHVQHASAVR